MRLELPPLSFLLWAQTAVNQRFPAHHHPLRLFLISPSFRSPHSLAQSHPQTPRETPLVFLLSLVDSLNPDQAPQDKAWFSARTWLSASHKLGGLPPVPRLVSCASVLSLSYCLAGIFSGRRLNLKSCPAATLPALSRRHALSDLGYVRL